MDRTIIVSMTQRWQLRRGTPDDLPAIVEIVNVEDLVYRGRSDIELDTLRQQITADPHFDAERDEVVAEVNGELVAAAIIDPHGANIAVHPDHESDTLRSELLAWVQRRQSELGRERWRVAVSAANGPAVAMVAGAGYVVERFYASMIRDFSQTGPPEPAQVPGGYRLRPIDPGRDIPALHAVDDRAFRERADYLPESLEEYDRRHLSLSAFAPEWSRVFETEKGELAASLVARRLPDQSIGYIAILAVDPDHRRCGLARNLLLAAFGAIHADGLPKAELHVASDNPKALDLYAGVGMSQTERFDHYVRTP
jgi:ribosomal protein S18 acetylase RimI-like enzyme